MLKNAGLMDARDYDTYITLFNHMYVASTAAARRACLFRCTVDRA